LLGFSNGSRPQRKKFQQTCTLFSSSIDAYIPTTNNEARRGEIAQLRHLVHEPPNTGNTAIRTAATPVACFLSRRLRQQQQNSGTQSLDIINSASMQVASSLNLDIWYLNRKEPAAPATGKKK
jgi:hypothetical protein